MSEQTIDAVRLAMGMAHRRAELAGDNIARAAIPGARAQTLDFASAQSMLNAMGSSDVPAEALEGQIHSVAAQPQTDLATPASDLTLDGLVAEMSASSMSYQALGEALGRQFALMRLAVGGRN